MMIEIDIDVATERIAKDFFRYSVDKNNEKPDWVDSVWDDMDGSEQCGDREELENLVWIALFQTSRETNNG